MNPTLLAATATGPQQLYEQSVHSFYRLLSKPKNTISDVNSVMDNFVIALQALKTPEDKLQRAITIKRDIDTRKQGDLLTRKEINAFIKALSTAELFPATGEKISTAIERLQAKTNPLLSGARSTTTLGPSGTAIRYKHSKTIGSTVFAESPPLKAHSKNLADATPDKSVAFEIEGKEGEARYLVTGTLGDGAGGDVYRAWDTRIGREVAIKVLKKGGDDQLQLLQNELHLQGKIRDPRIVEVYDVGKTVTGKPFAIMQLMNNNLYSYIEEQKERNHFDLEERLDLAKQVVAAVAQAHKAVVAQDQKPGVIHRDLKPDNFFLYIDNKKRITVHLGDFGIATTIDSIEKAQKEAKEPLQGSPHYMAASDFQEDIPDGYHRDVYALGTILYELFADQLPYDCDYKSWQDIQALKEANEPLPLKEMASTRNIPETVHRVISKALSREPKDRYADAEEMLFELITHKAQTSEQAAKDLLRESNEQLESAEASRGARNLQKINDKLSAWRDQLNDAITEYDQLYQLYRLDKIKARLIIIYEKLLQMADRNGDEKNVERLSKKLLALDAENSILSDIQRPIQVSITYDGNPQGARIALQRETNTYGVLTFAGKHRLNKAPIALDNLTRGAAYYFIVNHPDYCPVKIPLPVRRAESQEKHPVHIPFYPEKEIPTGWVLIPAGRVAVRRSSIGGFSKRVDPDDWRTIPYDYAMGPKPSNQDYLNFLITKRSHIPKEEALTSLKRFAHYIPIHWHADIRRKLLKGTATPEMAIYANNKQPVRLDLDAAVTGVFHQHAVEFLEATYPGKRARPANLDELKMAARGSNNARYYPWGDEDKTGSAVYLYPYTDTLRAVPANNYEGTSGPILDESPYSIKMKGGASRIVRHLVGGSKTLLHPYHPTLARIASIDSSQTSTQIYVTGTHYNEPAPQASYMTVPLTPQIIDQTSFFPVIPLRDRSDLFPEIPR